MDLPLEGPSVSLPKSRKALGKGHRAKGIGQQTDLGKSARACLGGRGFAPARGQAGAGRFVDGQIRQGQQTAFPSRSIPP